MLQYNICIKPEWIPREENVWADFYSRIIDYDDWSINHRVFEWIDGFWGPHTVDRFANSHNAQLDRFNSRFWDVAIGSEAVDAFTTNWASENNWWCPPFGLVGRVLQHAKVCGCVGTLVIPWWKSAPFWPLLAPEEGIFLYFVQEVIPLPFIEGLIVPGRSGMTLSVGNAQTPSFLALRLNFCSTSKQCTCQVPVL